MSDVNCQTGGTYDQKNPFNLKVDSNNMNSTQLSEHQQKKSDLLCKPKPKVSFNNVISFPNNLNINDLKLNSLQEPTTPIDKLNTPRTVILN